MESPLPAGKMQRAFKKASKISQQTWALLWKNILLVWRKKTESFQEWITIAILLLIIQVSSSVIYNFKRQEIPYKFLGRLDDPTFRVKEATLIYTPATSTTRKIMERVASDSVLKGITIEEAVNEKNLSARGIFKYDAIGVVFKDDFSYHLRFQSYSVISPVDAFEHIDTCYDVSSPYCKIPSYWYEGFLSIQSSIDAAVIEMKTNHSVWEEMKSISGIRLQSPLIKSIYKVNYIWFTIYSVLCFSPYVYFLSVKVIREKKKLKVLMKAMGLQDIAFWLSWSLLYTIYIAITSSLLAAITVGEVTQDRSFSEIYFLYFFYGIASIHFCFMLSSLLKQPHITSFVGFFLHIVFGSLGFMTLFEQVPPSLEWVFNLFSPYTFTAGISKIVKLEKYGPTVATELYPFFNQYSMLILDSILYLLLAIYFDKVLPGKYGVPYPPLFFLRPSYWLQQDSKCSTQPDPIPVPGCDTEPMPEGFEGKEAIRLYNIRKIYERKGKRTEALRGLSFSIYEGQITALLGLSGSGKTALLNVLSGFSKPSAGSAVIYNYKVSEVQDMEGIQAVVGICPQLNLHFEALTVKENLRIFAHVKGIRWKEVEQEVQKVLVQLDLTDLQDVHADSLSGGQKRKLSLAIAILGDPQVLLLDEPMVGLDPCSRHHVWELLAERRAGRVTLICTQSVEEADACADRKAFLSNGRLQCVGSSLYLKRKWGIGYHLRMCINDQCDPGLASSLVRQYIPNAVLKGRDRDELCYMLPLENTKSFPDLLGHLDNGLLLGVVHYEVSRTTLADALLKLEGKEDIDHKENLKESDQNFLGFSEPAHTAASGMELWRQQVLAVARVRFYRLRHDGKLLRSLLLFFGVFIIQMLMFFFGFNLRNKSISELTASKYFLPAQPPTQTQSKATNLLIFNDTGSEIEDFIAALKIQNIMPEITLEKNITSLPQHNGAIKISLEGKHRHYTLMCGAEPINCFPVLINTLSNTFLRLFSSTARIRIWSHPFSRAENPEAGRGIFFLSVAYMLIWAAGLPPHFAVSSVEDYKKKARAQLRVSGLFPSAYWCGQALVDVPLFWALMCLMFIVVLLFNRICPMEAFIILPMVFSAIGYGVSLIFLVYLIAFMFRKRRTNRYLWSFVFVLVNFTLHMLSNSYVFFYIFSTLVPPYPLLGWLIFSTRHLSFISSSNLLRDEWSNILVAVFAPYIHSVFFGFLLCCLEIRYGEAVAERDPIFRIQWRRALPPHNSDPPGQEPPEVQAERKRARSAAGSRQPEESVIVVNGLRKEYEDKKACSIFKKKKKVAVKNLSFCVKKGEVLGLLGPNGAGKSTTIRMISGDIAVTAGEVLLQGCRAVVLGCCPQEDPLWLDLTVLQHLEAYAAVRGVRGEDAAVLISRAAKALDLQKCLKTPVRRLSAGEARKLCFALSILGNPTVMLWDEPSAGMDVAGQHCLRKAIQASVRSKECAAMLSTHCLEEAAMCDRVAVLVAGQLRYIGSPEEMRRKFGTSYILEVKPKDVGQSDALHSEIVHLFPGAARQKRISSLLTYKIPKEDVLPLSQAFSKLEAAKQNFKLEEYSLSLHTLQQVFMDFNGDLEEPDLEAAAEEAAEQRLLQP
ncbi:ATP-binding cassette sub-family A member 9-like [Centrocercus urophasianus]|uniref:ATP-binding cassette sub-family A member 9-like n=1 Tax=Centrocercus urophasianus TaxID=9002 RepID=UPI001C649616|nr:ATP-binding cassette sub-family A member 9-like [Centrocercus urophasianus]XP_042688744.1 ATP-binding cassette sub-family A member 9-like [Centrocercus urophasianus]XP_042688745.1 ATP-binding cassette sub-family A member 9-like [Centrocercus urophasianus]XP_042688746.1 ATP-binding cassette sub-family A member 9-like [Centrocercus urophasianus]XP_042688747.1 ATP-binding cassette sub-family A member 9-like [Centrocercus urophasianus]